MTRGHLVAGIDDVGVGQSIGRAAAISLGLDEPGGAHDREMLRRVGLADTELRGQASDLAGPLSQEMQDGDAGRVREGAADLGLELVDRVHGPEHRHMRTCA